jgi:GntR family transcriptional repressor for pyruvate dehydrogenase complex
MADMLKPIRPQTSASQAVQQIRQLIKDRKLRPGDRLPSVRGLAEHFGVSTATVREAIQILSTLRLVDVRQGRGIFVAPLAGGSDDPAHWLPWLEAHRDDVLALLEVREVLESKAAALAAEAAASGDGGIPAHLEALQRTVDMMEAAAQEADLGGLERADLEFHSLVAELGGNPYLMYLSRSINHIFADRRAVMALPGRPAQSIEQHREIIGAIASGDPARAADAMSRHLASTIASVRALRATGRSGDLRDDLAPEDSSHSGGRPTGRVSTA